MTEFPLTGGCNCGAVRYEVTAPLVKASNGTPLRLYDLFARHRHTLLLLGEGSEDTLGRPPPDMARHLSVQHISGAGTAEELIDREGVAAAGYASIPAAYVIRPDGYIGFRAAPGEVSTRLPRYLAKILPAQR